MNAHVGLSELVTHAAWLRRLAVGLLRDPDAADDVVQSTLVAAWRNPPSADRDVRPWLAEVTRNQAHDQRRGEGRRRAREAVAHEAAVVAEGERAGAISPEALIGELEVHRQVAEVVAALAEPYRSTVVLHYYDGLDSTEVAQRLGVAAGTIRWRLKEGLEQIRIALDRKSDGERARWQRALLPLVPVRAALRGSGGAGVVGSGRAAKLAGRLGIRTPVLLVAATIVVVVAVLAVVLIAVSFRSDARDEQRAGAETVRSQATARAFVKEGEGQLRRVPRLAGPVAARARAEAPSPQVFAEQVLDRMLAAIVDDAYESFIGHGGDVFNARISREMVSALNKELGKRLAGGFESVSLGSLRKTLDAESGERHEGAHEGPYEGPYTVHLWKLGFRDTGDDVIVYLSLKGGQVIGFIAR